MDERVHFITKVHESDESFTALCRHFGISRKTGYKWVARYEKLGPAGLLERPPVAQHSPHRTDEALITAILELRKEHPTWGPKKLKARLEALGNADVPAASTIGDMLKKHGLVRPRRRRVAVPPFSPHPLSPAALPNDTWCVDFKGHFALGDRTRCHPLTVTDQATRYLLKCEAVDKPDEAHVRPHFERAFHEFGLPLRIRSDNGPPFATMAAGGLSALSVWWIKLGILPERIEPGKPQQNGRHERMHKTLQEDAATPPSATRREQQLGFDRFRHVYNDVRPHEALEQKTPASRYTPSRRTMPATLLSPDYPDTMQIRRVDTTNGLLSWQGHTVRVGGPLNGEPVGLEPIDGDAWRLFYGPVVLGELRLRGKQLHFDKQR